MGWGRRAELILVAVVAAACGDSTVAGETDTGAPEGRSPILDGIARREPDGWLLRVVTSPLGCSDEAEPIPGCGWYDLQITLDVDELEDGLVIAPESQLGSAHHVFVDTEFPFCGLEETCCDLVGTVTIVDVKDDRVIIKLGMEWASLPSEPGATPGGLKALVLCD